MNLVRMLSAIGIMAALAGCRTCWIDRDDDRPMKYGSFRDSLSYGWWGECFHPHYHCGPPDGIRDHISVKKAAVKSANRALSDQNCGTTSRDFRFGFQQAYIDIANGGSGALPAIPPSRYWAAPYRTTWGHNKAREWFSGYEAGVSAAKCCMPADTLSVPTSVYRGCDNRLAVGLGGGAFGAAPIVDANHRWAGEPTYPTSPMMGNPDSMTPNMFGPHSTRSYNGPMSAQPPTMMAPAMSVPQGGSIPGSGWSMGPSPALPSYPTPTYSVPSSPIPGSSGGGYSIPVPNNEVVSPPVTPMHGQSISPSATSQRDFSENNPWGRFSGMNGFGFKSEGASR